MYEFIYFLQLSCMNSYIFCRSCERAQAASTHRECAARAGRAKPELTFIRTAKTRWYPRQDLPRLKSSICGHTGKHWQTDHTSRCDIFLMPAVCLHKCLRERQSNDTKSTQFP